MPFAHAKLRALRENAGESREQVAVAVGRSYSGIVLFETGKRVPTAEVIERLAIHYGVPIDALFTDRVVF